MTTQRFALMASLAVAALLSGIGLCQAQTYGPLPGVNYDLPNYAYSPQPTVTRDPVTGAVTSAVGGMRKFIDRLPGLGPTTANGLGQYIPVAVPDTTTYTSVNAAGATVHDEYYEIALVEYRERMHSDLPLAGTQLRGYVQLETPVVVAKLATTVTPSKHVALKYPDGSAILDAAGAQIYAVDNPHYLGPMIVATKDVPVRVKFLNLLPTGAAGDLFIPTDVTIMGAGEGNVQIGTDPATGAPIYDIYSQNRATLHLHGGFPGWISDGTPHQWVAPRGEVTSYPKGASMQNVPDMPDPGPGAFTMQWTNQQSGRLLWYHDHAYGLTGVNVYAGEVAGYLVRDPMEQALTNGSTPGIPPMEEIPLIIQDRTFVWGDPVAGTGTWAVDPLWDAAKWGGAGNFWFPHVYMINQDPYSMEGATPFGRWDYGPWFWPVFPVTQMLPMVSHVPEAFMDTPVINGTAYPYAEVQPTTYRFRILNGCNDRFVNLQLYQADPTGYAINATGTSVTPGTGFGTEVPMVPAEANPAIPFPPAWLAQTPGMVPDVLDGRIGGVPNPSYFGPTMIQIGTEGGLLPAPVELPNQPIGFEQNKRNIVVLNVKQKTLFLAPAERADVIIDFSAFAGKTVILYNDSPAPVPAGDPRNEGFTNNLDQTGGGGAPATIPGYGSNTRTLLQFRVASATPSPTFTATSLTAPLAAAYVATQETPIVQQAAYGPTYGTTYQDVFSRIQDTSLPTTPQPLGSLTLTASGKGYTSAPTVGFLGGNGTGAAATATVAGGKITALTLTNSGSGYIYPPTVTFTGGGGTGATATAVLVSTLPMLPKCIQELFDPAGRMNATLGVELPFTTALIQTTIPLGYVDPATETVAPGETQIWKITHNGVDTHGVHFHLLDVQLINRVGWDGAITPPDANEIGWKDTVRMNPLEDIIVAVRAKTPQLPYGLPESVRLLDVTQPVGSTMNFTNVDPLTGNAPPTPVTNVMTNFGWEYVWHCHILGHEENDMMRPIVYNVGSVIPTAPSGLVGVINANGLQTDLTWTDPTPAMTATTLGNAANEIGFRIERAAVTNAVTGAFSPVGYALANATAYSDTTIIGGGNNYAYQVIAYNAAGNSPPSNPAMIATPTTGPGAPTGVVAAAGYLQATVTFGAPVNNGGSAITGYTVLSNPAGGTDANAGATGLTHTVTGLTAGVSYDFTVIAQNAVGTGPASAPPSNSVIPYTLPGAPTGVAATSGVRQATVTFTAPAPAPSANGFTPITGYTVTSLPAGGVDANAGTADVSHLITGLANGTTYTFTVQAANAAGTGPASAASAPVTTFTVPGAPTGVAAVAGIAQATVTFAAPAFDGGSPVTGYAVTSIPAGGVDTSAGNPGLNHLVTGLANGTSYTFTVQAANAVGTGPASIASAPVTTPAVPDAPTGVTAVAGIAQATVTFAASAANGGSPITGYTVTSIPAGGVDTNAGSTGLSHLITGLANGGSYTFTVQATNALGIGPASAPSAPVTTLAVPGAPTGVAAVAGNTQATVTFGGPGLQRRQPGHRLYRDLASGRRR